MKVHVAQYRAWLDEAYQAETVRTLVNDLRTLIRSKGAPPGTARVQAYRRTVRLYNAFAELQGLPALQVTFPPPPPKDPRSGGGKMRAKKRVLPIPPDKWHALEAAVRRDPSPEARVLAFMMATGLRIGDALRIHRRQIEEGFTRSDHLTEVILKGGKPWLVDVSGAPDEWQGLLTVAKRSAAGTVAGGLVFGGTAAPGGGAYQRVRRRWQHHTAALGLGKQKLHRIRHTWGNRAAEKDPALSRWIQKALGHERPETSDKYTAGSLAHRVAEIQRAMRSNDTTES